MRSRRRYAFPIQLAIAILLLLTQNRVRATNHEIHIKEIMAGANGDSKVQFLVIEQEFAGQNLWGPTDGSQSAAMLVFFDARGRETGKFKFPSNPNTTPNLGTAVSPLTLIATQEFADLPGAPAPDFIIPPLLNPISGKVCFKNNPLNIFAFQRNECVSYGSFTGDTELNSGDLSATPAGPPAPALSILNTVSLRRTLDTEQNSDFVISNTPTPSNTDGKGFTIPVAGPIEQGANLFSKEEFLGNGRTCASCHVGSQSFRLPPDNVQSRFATLSSTFDPQFVGESKPSAFDDGFDFNVNLLVLTAEVTSNAPCTGDLRGIITSPGGGRAKVLTRMSPKAYLVYGGINPALSGTVSDTHSCSGTVASITSGNLAQPAGSGVKGLEDPMRMRRSASSDFPQGRALILENIDGFTNPPVFRKSPHLLNLDKTAPFGFSGNIADLQTFAAGAVTQHFTRPTNFTVDASGSITIDASGILSTRRSGGPSPDFRTPTPDELADMEAFLRSLEFPAGDDPDKFNLDRFAVTAEQKRGRDAFFGEAKCIMCHGGTVLATTTASILGKPIGINASFNTGVVNQLINSPVVDSLPCEPSVGVCGSREFSVPQLFNVKHLTPLFHDASAATVRQAVEFYTSAAFNSSPAGVAIGGISMSAGTVNDIAAFLEGLSAGTISANSATTLKGASGSSISPRPSVLVRDGDGNPMPGVTVTFRITSGAGTVLGTTQVTPTQATVTTDALGIATVGSWVLAVGANTLTASADAAVQGNPVTFNAVGIPQPIITGIAPNTGTVGATLAVTIFGTNLSSAKAVDFNPPNGLESRLGSGGTATSVTAIVKIAAGGAPGIRTITVTTDAGPSPPFTGFTVGTGFTITKVWGGNDAGQLGFANPVSELTPGLVLGLGPGSGVTAVAAGGNSFTPDFSLALKSDGIVLAWGSNSSGQLGDGTTLSRTAPVPVNGLGSGSGVVAIAAGSRHSLALKSDGSVLAWGANDSGQLGDGSTIFRRTYTQVEGLGPGSGVIAIAAGDRHSLALKSDGTVLAWGENFVGQLGDGTTNSRFTPVVVNGLGSNSGIIAIAAGQQHNLAVKSDGSVLAWGANFSGQVGDGTTSSSRTTPVSVLGLGSGSGVISVSAGNQHSMALKSDGSVLAWGNNGAGQLGDGSFIDRTAPGPVSGLGSGSGVVVIDAASDSSLARKSDGSVVAWGNNNFSQLGTGTFVSRGTPVQVTGLAPGSGVIAISGAGSHSLAAKSDGSVLAWGNNSAGQLGNGGSDGKVSPFPLTGLDGTISVAAGTFYSLALKADGTVLAWGNNNNGQLGDGTFTSRATPFQVDGFGPGSRVIAITAGGNHALALKSDGSVLAWGNNGSGQLGDGSFNSRTAPVQVAGLGPGSGVIAIAAGDSHSLALKSDGTVVGWGANFTGQLGDNTNNTRNSPVQVNGFGPGSGVSAITAGSQHSLALKSDGSVLAWGAGFSGQLGDGTFNTKFTPVQVTGLGPGSSTVMIAAGNSYSLALKSDGSVLSWGDDSQGQLGDGTVFFTRGAPIPVTGLGSGSGVIAIAAGNNGNHSMALKSGGAVVAWGSNINGQLGNGTLGMFSSLPVPVITDPEEGTIIAISAGSNHSLAVEATGGPPVLPAITGISPSSGKAGTSFSATISGTDLSGATGVNFSGSGVIAKIGTGGTATSLPINIEIAANAAADVRSVTVTTGAGTSGSFTGFTVTSSAPKVTSITPSSGAPGGTFPATISGENLTGASAVTFSGSGVRGTIVSATATSVTANITIDAGSTPDLRTLTVTAGSVTSASFSGFTVVPTGVPIISSINPNSGKAGTTVSATITGQNLSGASAVTFSGTGLTGRIVTGGTATSLPVSIVIDADAKADLRTVTVATLAGTAAAFSGFTVTPGSGAPPAINELSANPAGLSQSLAPLYGGTFTLVVRGQNFDSNTKVQWGGVPLSTTFVSATQLNATVKTSQLTAPGTVLVTAVSPSGTSNGVSIKVVERGDMNANRSVNIGDALTCALTVGGTNTPPLPLTVGDVNLNGSTNIGDCLVTALFAVQTNAKLSTPSITQVSPAIPNLGELLTVTGTGFSPVAADNRVFFTTVGRMTGVIPSSATTTTLKVTVPGDAQSGPMQVARLDVALTGNEFPLAITGTAIPLALMQVSPFFNVSPGSSVTLTGLGFSTTPAANTVLFQSATGTTAGTVTAATAGALTVTMPADAVCGPVTVGVGNQTSEGRMVTVAGTACGLQLVDILGNPSPGDTMVLEGGGFDITTPRNNLVKFSAAGGGTVDATILQASATQLELHVPESVAAGNITATVASITSNALAFVPSSPTTPASVDVVVTSANAVGAYQITIGFDKNIVTVNAANVKGGTGDGFTDAPMTINVDNQAGTVTINHFQTGISATGTFTVANLVFTPVATGTSPLTVSGVSLIDINGDDLPPNGITLSSGSITVLRVP